MVRNAGGLALTALLLGAGTLYGTRPALSATTPIVTPTVDVDIIYRAALPDGGTIGQRMRWSAASWRQRVDPANSDTFMLTDYHTGTLSVVDMQHHTLTRIAAPGGPLAPPGTAVSGNYTQLESAHIAGEDCQWWRTSDTDGQQGDFCYSADGLLLAARHGSTTVISAVTVARTAQDSRIFEVPAGLSEQQAAHP